MQHSYDIYPCLDKSSLIHSNTGETYGVTGFRQMHANRIIYYTVKVNAAKDLGPTKSSSLVSKNMEEYRMECLYVCERHTNWAFRLDQFCDMYKNDDVTAERNSIKNVLLANASRVFEIHDNSLWITHIITRERIRRFSFEGIGLRSRDGRFIMSLSHEHRDLYILFISKWSKVTILRFHENRQFEINGPFEVLIKDMLLPHQVNIWNLFAISMSERYKILLASVSDATAIMFEVSQQETTAGDVCGGSVWYRDHTMTKVDENVTTVGEEKGYSDGRCVPDITNTTLSAIVNDSYSAGGVCVSILMWSKELGRCYSTRY